MRDFYDVYMLLSLYKGKIDSDTLEKAFESTCKKRKTDILKVQGESILDNIATSEELRNLWKAYQKKYSYARDISYDDVILAVSEIFTMAVE